MKKKRLPWNLPFDHENFELGDTEQHIESGCFVFTSEMIDKKDPSAPPQYVAWAWKNGAISIDESGEIELVARFAKSKADALTQVVDQLCAGG